jgi:hypothetical protein
MTKLLICLAILPFVPLPQLRELTALLRILVTLVRILVTLVRAVHGGV